MAKIPFKMRSGNSPLFKQVGSSAKVDYDITQQIPSSNINPAATTKTDYSKSRETTAFEDFGSDVSEFQSDLTKKHDLYKDKKLSLRGQVDMPQVNVAWNPKGNITPFGSPTVNFANSANISGSSKLGKNTTLSGNVNYASGQSPKYKAGLKINF